MSGYDDPAWIAEQQAKAKQEFERNRIADWEWKYGVTVHAVRSASFRRVLGVVVALVAAWMLLRGESATLSDIETLLRPLHR